MSSPRQAASSIRVSSPHRSTPTSYPSLITTRSCDAPRSWWVTAATAPRCVPYATACRWSACPPREPDQAPITQLLEQWKVSRALPGDADVAQIRAAADEVLSNPICRAEAKQRSLAFVGLDGAELAADSVEALIAGA